MCWQIVIKRQYMVLHNLVNIMSGNGLFPDSTKPLPEPMFAHYQGDLVVFIHWQFLYKGFDARKCIGAW